MYSDNDACYEETIEIDVAALEPQVAAPHSPDNVMPVSRLERTVVDQVFLGSCTNGRIGDLRIAAGLFKGKKVAPGVRLLVTPASPEVLKKALREGLVDTFLEVGAVLMPPSLATSVRRARHSPDDPAFTRRIPCDIREKYGNSAATSTPT